MDSSVETAQTKTLTMKELKEMEALGFAMFGKIFKDTLTYIQIQRKKREVTKND